MVTPVLTVAGGAASPVRAATLPACGDVQMIWARGSGFDVDSADFRQFDLDLKSRIASSVSYSTYQLGRDGGYGGYSYPARGDFMALVDAQWWLPTNPYDSSVSEGRSELVAYLSDRAAACPNETYVLGGWSQGAQVTGEALPKLSREVRDRIAFVALFGDPYLNTGNRWILGQTVPSACWSGKKPWVRGSAPCWIAGGQLGSRDPYVPGDMEQRVGSWCREFDGVCDGSFVDLAPSLAAGTHFQYYEPNSDMASAAYEAVKKLREFVPDQAAAFDVSWIPFSSGISGFDLAFVFDTTGSMGDDIDSAKSAATEIAQRWVLMPNGRVGLVQYRDQGDSFVSRLELGLTNDPSAFQAAVDSLTADEGGDYEESLLTALMTALDGMDWRDGASKVIVVITDAPGKDPEPETGLTMAQVIMHAVFDIDPVAIYGINTAGEPDVTDFLGRLASGTSAQVLVPGPDVSLADALFELIDVVAYNPVATLTGPYIASTGAAILFDASGSCDPDAELVSYEWDFDSDGDVDRTTTSAETEYAYPGEYHGLATLRVVSSDGGSALATTQVTVDSVGLGNLMPIEPSSASATISGPDSAIVGWVPAPNDRADAYRISTADGRLVGLSSASAGHSVTVTGLDFSQPIVFQVVSSNGYGTSSGVSAPPVGGVTDDVAPVSRAAALSPLYTTNAVSIPFTASDAGGSGVSTVELWARYRANRFGSWSAWSLALAGTTSPMSYSFPSGDGDYEFYTIAVDGAGNREAAPATADATTKLDAVDDPPAIYSWAALAFGPSTSPAKSRHLFLLASGVAFDDRSAVSVSWELWGVKSNGSRQKLSSYKRAIPLDGRFNSPLELFILADERADSGWVSYEVHIKATAAGVSAEKTVLVPICRQSLSCRP
jgi:hypothetical protein